jgi:hypothetical protein
MILGALAIFAVAIIGTLQMAGVFDQAAVPQSIVIPGATTPTGQLKNVCTGGQTASYDQNVYDVRNVNTAFTDPALVRKVGDAKWQAATEGTALTTLVPGSDYEFVLGIAANDFVDEAYGPYLKIQNLPCVETTEVESADNEPETGLTCTFYNEDNNAASQTMSANTDYNVKFKVRASSENYFGNPYLDSYSALGLGDMGNHRITYPNVIAIQLNTTTQDVPRFIRVSGTSGKMTFEGGKWVAGKQVLSSTEMNKIPCPDRVATEHGSSTDNTYCYEMPIVGDSDLWVELGLDTDDSNAPEVDDQAFIYAAGVYLNDKGVLGWGVETDLGADVANDDADTCTIDLTA